MSELLREVWFKKQPFPQCVPMASPDTSWSPCRLLGCASGTAGSACGPNSCHKQFVQDRSLSLATPGSVCVLTKSVTMQKGKPWHVAVMFKTGWMFRDSHLTFAWFGRCAFLHRHFFLYSAKIHTDTVFSADKCKLVHKGECTSLIPCALQLTPDYFYLSGVRSRGQGESTPEMAAQYLERSRK